MKCQGCGYELLSMESRVVIMDNIRGAATFCSICTSDPISPGFKRFETAATLHKDVKVVHARGRCASCGKLVIETDGYWITEAHNGIPALLRCKPCQDRIDDKTVTESGDIVGLQIIPLRRIPDERGTVMHILKASDPWFDRFGEVYASTIYAGVVKGWHRHKEMGLKYSCVFGRIKLVIYDDRQDSATRGNVEEIFLGPDNHSLVVIPPGLWNGFKGLAEPFSVVINCATHPHDPTKTDKLSPDDDSIPYQWGLVQR